MRKQLIGVTKTDDERGTLEVHTPNLAFSPSVCRKERHITSDLSIELSKSGQRQGTPISDRLKLIHESAWQNILVWMVTCSCMYPVLKFKTMSAMKKMSTKMSVVSIQSTCKALSGLSLYVWKIQKSHLASETSMAVERDCSHPVAIPYSCHVKTLHIPSLSAKVQNTCRSMMQFLTFNILSQDQFCHNCKI